METTQYLNIFRDQEISPHTIADIEDIYMEIANSHHLSYVGTIAINYSSKGIQLEIMDKKDLILKSLEFKNKNDAKAIKAEIKRLNLKLEKLELSIT